MELNTLYEYLYDLGLHLQTEGSLDVFKAGFRPWPHVFKGGGRSKKFYIRVDANLDEDLARIGINSHRADKDSYTAILREVLNCFGIGIIDSLEYTMKNYIKQTGGELCNDNREEWENKAIAHMVSHNNYAERPFAVVKAFARMYPSLSLRNLSHLTKFVSPQAEQRCPRYYTTCWHSLNGTSCTEIGSQQTVLGASKDCGRCDTTGTRGTKHG